MSRRILEKPPIKTPVSGADGFLHPIWARWFEAMYRRIGGSTSDDLSFREDSFTPEFVNVSFLGNVTTSGHYWKNGSQLYFEVTILVGAGATSSGVGAQLTNVPFAAANVGVVDAIDVVSNNRLGEGSIAMGTQVAQLPVWTDSPNTIVIQGTVEV